MLLGLAEQNQLYSPYSPYKKTTVPTAVPTPSLQSLESHASLDSVDDKLAIAFLRRVHLQYYSCTPLVSLRRYFISTLELWLEEY